jgi:hypothetical protein
MIRKQNEILHRNHVVLAIGRCILRPCRGIFIFILVSVYMVVVRVCTLSKVPHPSHLWVHQHRDEIIAGRHRSKGLWISWADAESDDDNDKALRSNPRAKLTRAQDCRSRSPSNRTGASSSMPGGQPAPPSVVNPQIRFANSVAFHANSEKTAQMNMPDRQSLKLPSEIFRCSGVEVWLGALLHYTVDASRAVARHSLVVDCCGGRHFRPWTRAAFANTALLECPWDGGEDDTQVAHLATVLNWIIANVLKTTNAPHAPQSIVVLDRMGDSRSAAFVAVMLITLFDFTLSAASAQITDRRPTAKLEGPAALYNEVEAVLERVIAALVWQ